MFFGEFISESFGVSSHGENHKRVSRENLSGEIENIKKFNFHKNLLKMGNLFGKFTDESEVWFIMSLSDNDESVFWESKKEKKSLIYLS